MTNLNGDIWAFGPKLVEALTQERVLFLLLLPGTIRETGAGGSSFVLELSLFTGAQYPGEKPGSHSALCQVLSILEKSLGSNSFRVTKTNYFWRTGRSKDYFDCQPNSFDFFFTDKLNGLIDAFWIRTWKRHCSIQNF